MIRPVTMFAIAGVVASLALPGTGAAQVRSFTNPSRGNDQKNNDVPREYMPPRGMCRIWIDSVPARQQPAPTDCPTAVRNKPRNGRVIFGEDAGDNNDKKDRDPKKPKKPEGNDTN